MIFPLRKFLDYCAEIRITSKETGRGPLRLWGTQIRSLYEMSRALEDDVHTLVELKGRQVGETTKGLALDAFWLQRYDGMQGMLAAEDGPNLIYLRDVVREITGSPPDAYSLETSIDNPEHMKWLNGSRLMFSHAGRGGRLGRSRGINYLHATEVGSWEDEEGAGSLRASLADTHPRRLYIYESTARGYNLFHDMWRTAQTAPGQRAVFIGWWLREDRVVTPALAELWAAYGTDAPTEDERTWMRVVARQYDVTITPEQLAWYRWKLVEDFAGDETLRAQEHPCLPEDAFQSFGTKFIAPGILQKLRIAQAEAAPPTTYAYEWGTFIDTTTVRPADATTAPLLIWEEPEDDGAYMVSCHPAFSSSPGAFLHVVQVWRLYPDALVQVAEFASARAAMYQVGWVAIHMLGAYRKKVPCYFVMEVAGSGMEVLQGIQRIEQFDYGLSPALRPRGKALLDFVGASRQYLYRRPDTFSSGYHLQWQSSGTRRPPMLHSLRDTLERGAATIRSAALLDEASAVRQGGEGGTNDDIGSSGRQSDSRVMAAAMANKHWLDQAMPELMAKQVVPPKAPPREPETHVGAVLVGNFLANLAARGRR